MKDIIFKAIIGLLIGSASVVVFVSIHVVQIDHKAQIDSLKVMITKLDTNLNARIDTVIDTVRTRGNSVAKSIATLQDTLAAVIQKMKKFDSFHIESDSFHIEHDRKLRGKIDTLGAKIEGIDDSVASEVVKLSKSVDSLNFAFHAHTKASTQMDSSLKGAVRDIREQRDIMLSVRVFVGTEEALKNSGYLTTSRFMLLFRKNYKIKQFPDIKNGKAITVHIGRTFRVKGKLVALCGYQGKLRKGKDYIVIEGQEGQTSVVLSRSMIPSTHILAVLK